MGQTATPTTVTSLEVTNDTHRLPLLLSILESPYPQLVGLSDLRGSMI